MDAVADLGRSLRRFGAILLSLLALFLTNVAPFAGALLARRAVTRLLFGADVLAVVAMFACGPRISPLYAALHPFGVGVFIYAALRSACVALAKGGIEWRGTTYPLSLLKGAARDPGEQPRGLCYSLSEGLG